MRAPVPRGKYLLRLNLRPKTSIGIGPGFCKPGFWYVPGLGLGLGLLLDLGLELGLSHRPEPEAGLGLDIDLVPGDWLVFTPILPHFI